jgi:glycosyltransferase involved in cell wall biosynthesis
MQKPLVSVIITTKNEADVIERLLESIQKQIYKQIETIVVDNNSSDSTREIATKFTKYVYQYGPERSAQRNYGAKKAQGVFLFVLDADMELEPNVIEKSVNEMQKDKTLGCIALPEKPIATNFWEKVKAYERSFYSLEGDSETDAPRFFRKVAYEKAGGYDESVTGPEDWDLPETIKKLGFTSKWVRAYINHYERVPSLTSLFKKKYYYGLKAHRYFSKQNVSLVSAKTIYFLRPVFYRNWKILITHPLLTIAMFFMLTGEQVSGGLGFLVGKITNK